MLSVRFFISLNQRARIKHYPDSGSPIAPCTVLGCPGHSHNLDEASPCQVYYIFIGGREGVAARKGGFHFQR